MPDYAYLGVDPAGRERRGQVRAETPELAKEALAARRLYVVTVEPATAATAASAAAADPAGRPCCRAGCCGGASWRPSS
jgi:general secretion pathway protein F